MFHVNPDCSGVNCTASGVYVNDDGVVLNTDGNRNIYNMSMNWDKTGNITFTVDHIENATNFEDGIVNRNDVTGLIRIHAATKNGYAKDHNFTMIAEDEEFNGVGYYDPDTDSLGIPVITYLTKWVKLTLSPVK